MKITGVETYPISVPEPHWGGTEWYFLRLTTDESIDVWRCRLTVAAFFEVLRPGWKNSPPDSRGGWFPMRHPNRHPRPDYTG